MKKIVWLPALVSAMLLLTGCDLVKGLFKVTFWTSVILAVVVVLVVLAVLRAIRRRV